MRNGRTKGFTPTPTFCLLAKLTSQWSMSFAALIRIAGRISFNERRLTKHWCRGFTFIEVIVVLAVIAVMAVVAATGFQNFNRSASLDNAAQEVGNALIDARNSTLASDGNTFYGVHIEKSQVVRFTGASYSSTSPNNSSYVFTGDVTASSSLTGSSTEVTFGRLTGLPSATGTITVTSGYNNATRTVTIGGSGLIE